VNELPESLRRYEDELRSAVRTDRRRTTTRRRATRLGVVALAGAAVALGVFASLPGGGESGGVARAAAVLRVSSGTILHTDMTGRQDNPDGSVATWRDERWQLMAPPFDARQVETSFGVRAETATSDTKSQLYDAATNTIYTHEPEPKLRFEKGPSEGTLRLVVPQADGTSYTKVIRKADVKKLSGDAQSQSGDEPFRTKILMLLSAGKAKEAGHVEVGGRDALKLELGDGSTYLVDADTYDPIEYTTRGTGGSTTLTFRAYEKLPASPENRALLSLRAQHPDARVDDSAAHYEAAQARLFPHG
jgi:hypothetical protein